MGQGQGRAWALLLALRPVCLVRKPAEGDRVGVLWADPKGLWVRPQASLGAP